MLIDEIAKSLPKENVLAHTYERRKALANNGYVRKTAFRNTNVTVDSKPLIIAEKPLYETMAAWCKALTTALEITHKRAEKPHHFYKRSKALSLAVIMNQVSEKYGVSIVDIKSKRRSKRFMIPRMEFYWRARHESKASYPDIGRFCGGRDHTTVLYGANKYAFINGMKGDDE